MEIISGTQTREDSPEVCLSTALPSGLEPAPKGLPQTYPRREPSEGIYSQRMPKDVNLHQNLMGCLIHFLHAKTSSSSNQAVLSWWTDQVSSSTVDNGQAPLTTGSFSNSSGFFSTPSRTSILFDPFRRFREWNYVPVLEE
jgi:hypothetical protein